MWLGRGGDYAAFIAPRSAVGCRAGVAWEQHFDPPLAAAAGAGGTVTLAHDGVLRRHDGEGSADLWRLEAAPSAEGGPLAVSPDGSWVFDGQRLVFGPGAGLVREPYAIDFFERWTFATSLRDGQLALAFESSQPWSENGSYGDRYGGVEVLHLTPETDEPRMLSLSYDYRAHDATYAPLDVAWHPRGVLATLRDDMVSFHRLTAPRGLVPWEAWPASDTRDAAAIETEYDLAAAGARALAIDEDGRWIAAAGPDELLVVDLDLRRYTRVARTAHAMALSADSLVFLDERLWRQDVGLADLRGWELY